MIVALTAEPKLARVMVRGAALAAVALLGCGVAMPSLLGALDRDATKRTMSDMRTIATAVESYSIDNEFYPMAADIEELRTYLEPTYIKDLPGRDGWGDEFMYQSADHGERYAVASSGGDGAFGRRDLFAVEGGTMPDETTRDRLRSRLRSWRNRVSPSPS